MEGAVVVEVVSTTATGMLSFGLEEFSEEDDAAAARGNAWRAALSSLLMALVASVGLCWNAFRNSIRVEDQTSSEFLSMNRGAIWPDFADLKPFLTLFFFTQGLCHTKEHSTYR
jgi:hypothetical protein